MCTLVTKTVMRDGAELGSVPSFFFIVIIVRLEFIVVFYVSVVVNLLDNRDFVMAVRVSFVEHELSSSEECPSLWADDVTLAKKVKNLSGFRQIQASHFGSCAHRSPKAWETKLWLEAGSA